MNSSYKISAGLAMLVLAAALLLRHLGYESTAVRIEEAVEADMRANGARTRTTVEVGDDVLGFIG